MALLAYLEPSNLEDRVINRIEVVLEELVSNVVRHATGATQLTLLANAGDKGISLCVEDDGPAFNPLAAPDRKDFDKLENAALGGLGIPLIKRLTKSLDCETSVTAVAVSV